MTAELLSIRNLTVEYVVRGGRLQAVRNVSMDIPAGTITALVGESGSGKTSLAHAILRLLPISSGQMHFRGDDLAAMSDTSLREARKNIQAVFQDPFASLSPRRSILQSLVEPLDHYRIGKREDRQTVAAEALEAVELDRAFLGRYPHELSGGERQRVALARALVSNPALIIADEPLSSLDMPVQGRMVSLLKKLCKEHGIAFLVVSHDLSVVRQLAETVAVMYFGRLVESGPTKQVFAQPAHPYTQALLRAIPVPDPARPAPEVLAGELPSPLTPPSGCVFHKRCSKALPTCSSEEPTEKSVTRDKSPGANHRVRCHLWDS